MGLKLRKRDIPHVHFKRALPEYLADGKPCFLNVEARAAGGINDRYVALMDQANLARSIAVAKASEKTETEDKVRAMEEVKKQYGRDLAAVLYDACVISWETNAIDDDTGNPLEANRDNFLALADLSGVPEISSALIDLQRDCLEAGKVIDKQDEETAGN